MYKKIINILVVLVILLNPLVAQAGVISEFLDEVTASWKADMKELKKSYSGNNGFKMSSASKEIQSFGSMAIKPPTTKKIQIGFTITPPSLNIEKTACGFKLDGYLGGIAFLNGSHIKKLLAMFVSKAGIAFIMHLAMKILAPTIEAVLQMLQKLSQFAAIANLDACKAGEALADMAMQGLKNAQKTYDSEQARQGACQRQQVEEGDSKDFMSAVEFCGDETSVMEGMANGLFKGLGAINGFAGEMGSALDHLGCVMGSMFPKDATLSAISKDVAKIREKMGGPYNWTYEVLGGPIYCAKAAEDIEAGKNPVFDASQVYTGTTTTCAEVLLLMNMLGTTIVTASNSSVSLEKSSEAKKESTYESRLAACKAGKQ